MKRFLSFLLLTIAVLLSSCIYIEYPFEESEIITEESIFINEVSVPEATNILSIPEYSSSPYVVINGNKPNFSAEILSSDCFEEYSPLDSLGRCGVCIAVCGRELMPTAERGNISGIYPTGWDQRYYSFVEGEYLYNRSHLLGWQLTGEDANSRNLITGTRYMNVQGMLPFEEEIADYIKKTNNKVAYRVTPIFTGDNLLCDGVQMEAFSIEDNGKGICFNVFCYNVQPGIEIDYKTGSSRSVKNEVSEDLQTFVLNTNSKKVHIPSCPSVSTIAEHNKDEYFGKLEELISVGYSPCGSCLSGH